MHNQLKLKPSYTSYIFTFGRQYGRSQFTVGSGSLRLRVESSVLWTARPSASSLSLVVALIPN